MTYELISWFLITSLNVKGTLSCGSINVVYVISCQCYKFKYVGSALTLKERFHLDKSDINPGKQRSGAAKHSLECCSSEDKFDNIKIQLMESVNLPDNLLE